MPVFDTSNVFSLCVLTAWHLDPYWPLSTPFLASCGIEDKLLFLRRVISHSSCWRWHVWANVKPCLIEYLSPSLYADGSAWSTGLVCIILREMAAEVHWVHQAFDPCQMPPTRHTHTHTLSHVSSVFLSHTYTHQHTYSPALTITHIEIHRFPLTYTLSLSLSHIISHS